MKGRYVIAHDVGTSSTKAVLIDVNGNILETATVEYGFHYPKRRPFDAYIERRLPRLHLRLPICRTYTPKNRTVHRIKATHVRDCIPNRLLTE